MSHHSIVYGRIIGPGWKTEDYNKLHRLNQEVIETLSDNDKQYPWINQSMFNIPNEQGTFRDQVIAIGASYKNLEDDWQFWLMKFENILKALFWYDVVLHVEFEVLGSFQYEWIINNDFINSHWLVSHPKPITDWEFSGTGPRSF